MNAKKKSLSLADLENGQTGIIISMHDGKKASKRLADLGLKPGTELTVRSRTLFSGPVQIEVNGSKLVLGRGLASKIVVELK
jgi:Fe2+ transport system protein FeoA